MDLSAHAAALVADWPPLTQAQRDRLRMVFGPAVRRLAEERAARAPKPRRLTYSGVHNKLGRVLGPARKHPCVDCDDRADDWTYRGGDLNELQSSKGPYSEDMAFYDPRCRPCHARYDKGKAA